MFLKRGNHCSPLLYYGISRKKRKKHPGRKRSDGRARTAGKAVCFFPGFRLKEWIVADNRHAAPVVSHCVETYGGGIEVVCFVGEDGGEWKEPAVRKGPSAQIQNIREIIFLFLMLVLF